MAKYSSTQAEKEAAKTAAMLMAAAARTAPKTRGLDSTSTLVLDGDDIEKLASGMEKRAAQMPPHTAAILKGNAANVRVFYSGAADRRHGRTQEA